MCYCHENYQSVATELMLLRNACPLLEWVSTTGISWHALLQWTSIPVVEEHSLNGQQFLQLSSIVWSSIHIILWILLFHSMNTFDMNVSIYVMNDKDWGTFWVYLDSKLKTCISFWMFIQHTLYDHISLQFLLQSGMVIMYRNGHCMAGHTPPTEQRFME